MYLVDTDVVSEWRRGPAAHPGVQRFFRAAAERNEALYVSVITVGEIRRGADVVRHRGDLHQARRLDDFFAALVTQYADRIVDFGFAEAVAWARLRVPNAENALDKQIAATALTRGWTVVTRNDAHFEDLGVRVLNPFLGLPLDS